MANFTAQEAAGSIIISATFRKNWSVTVRDTDGIIYSIQFDGTDRDTVDEVLKKTYAALLTTSKKSIVQPDTPAKLKGVGGLNPKA